MQEKTIQIKQCKHCNSSFDITDWDLEFYEKVSPVFWTPPNLPLSGEELEQAVASSPLTRGELRGVLDLWNWKVKYLIPTPTLCPDCRQQRRLSFRNERHLYRRNCDATWKQIISMFSPDKPYKVYNPEFWWSDKWSAMDYAQDFDFSKSFFEQYDELLKKVPFYWLSVLYNTLENSDYNNASWYLKNCYMLFNSDDDENCFYWKWINRCDNVVDSFRVYDSSHLYECINCYNCYNSKYLINSKDCNSCSFSLDLINCKYCFWCSNLAWKEYYFFNEKFEKQDWEQKVKEYFKSNKVVDIRKKVMNNLQFVKFMVEDHIENSDGDYLNETVNCHNCFDVEFMSDSKYCSDLKKWDSQSYNNYDICQFWKWITNSYEWSTIWYKVDKCLFCSDLWDNSSDCLYSICCFWNCSNLFWCVWLRNKSYCILNKQYTKQQYEELVPKIIEYMIESWEWWEFFPSSISPFWYNETEAADYFPIQKKWILWCHSELVSESTKESTTDPEINSGWQLLHWDTFNWSTYQAPLPNVEKIIPANKLPYDIKDIPDDILNWAIECEITMKPYRIIKSELEFYRKHDLPIPKKHPDERHLDRLKLRNPRKLFARKCDRCWIDIKTTYSPDRKELVLCEKCYEGEVY